MVIPWQGLARLGIASLGLNAIGMAALVWGGNWDEQPLKETGTTCQTWPPIVTEQSFDLRDLGWGLADRLSLPPSLLQIQPYPLDRSALEAYADRLTVQVWGAEGLLGSGTLLGRSSLGVGWVLTNNHVLRWSSPPFRIHLSDRTVWDATWVPTDQFAEADLALLQVVNAPPQAAVSPQLASARVQPGYPQTVYAAGWIVENHYPHWQFVPGQLVYQLLKPLTGGYQLGYSSPVLKGMSGGPLLNERGQLVGMNGMVADPLWEIQHEYEDGTLPQPWIQALINGNSWGIPSDRFARGILCDKY
jgi:hypothetical protein